VFKRVRPTTSVGVASVRSAEVPLGTLLRRADVALYHAKEEGRSRTVVFDEAWHHATVASAWVEEPVWRDKQGEKPATIKMRKPKPLSG